MTTAATISPADLQRLGHSLTAAGGGFVTERPGETRLQAVARRLHEIADGIEIPELGALKEGLHAAADAICDPTRPRAHLSIADRPVPTGPTLVELAADQTANGVLIGERVEMLGRVLIAFGRAVGLLRVGDPFGAADAAARIPELRDLVGLARS